MTSSSWGAVTESMCPARNGNTFCSRRAIARLACPLLQPGDFFSCHLPRHGLEGFHRSGGGSLGLPGKDCAGINAVVWQLARSVPASPGLGQADVGNDAVTEQLFLPAEAVLVAPIARAVWLYFVPMQPRRPARHLPATPPEKPALADACPCYFGARVGIEDRPETRANARLCEVAGHRVPGFVPGNATSSKDDAPASCGAHDERATSVASRPRLPNTRY